MIQKDVISAGSEWKEKSVNEFPGSPFDRIGKGWMLITAAENIEKNKGNWNTMTASWGGLGVLWARNVAFVFVRPSRHTYGFLNNAGIFTLSFFDEAQRSALALCGEKSGRDIDKAAAAGLTPVVFGDGPAAGAVSFKEARDILFCKKIYTQDIDPAFFLDPVSIEENYHGKDYHRLYIGEVVNYKSR
jgi:flavin reductase (DIM6/NTAB) family NADH-FMN oxidoreductase RutF